MDDKREYDNPFEDFAQYKNNDIIDLSENTKIHAALYGKLRSAVERLLATLDAKHSRDKSDYSIYTGTTGIALLYLHIAEKQNNKAFLKVAAQMIEECLPRLKGRRYSMLTGDAGPLAIGAAVQERLGHQEEAQDLCRRLAELVPRALRDSELPDEVLYGRAGLLLALLFVRRHIGESAIEARALQQIVAAIIASGRAMASQTRDGPPLMFEWHGKKYLGGAHGLCGILQVLLLCRDVLGPEKRNELDTLVRGTLDWLLGQLLPSGNLPSSLGNHTDRLIHWCHGAPGLAQLLCLAARSLSEPHYLESARVCGDIVWRRGLLRKGCGICHGSAGNAYTFLVLYQATGEVNHLYRALRFAEWCTEPVKNQARYADRPFSLFEGLAGTIYFLSDVQNPLQAAFPTFN